MVIIKINFILKSKCLFFFRFLLFINFYLVGCFYGCMGIFNDMEVWDCERFIDENCGKFVFF